MSKKIHWKQVFSLRSLIYTILGVLSAVIALKGFMIPNHFLDGGVTGFSILLYEITHWNISIFLIAFNFLSSQRLQENGSDLCRSNPLGHFAARCHH